MSVCLSVLLLCFSLFVAFHVWVAWNKTDWFDWLIDWLIKTRAARVRYATCMSCGQLTTRRCFCNVSISVCLCYQCLGVGCGKGCPLPTGEGAVPSPWKKLILALNMVSFGAFWMVFFRVQLPVLHAKPEFDRYRRIKAVMVSRWDSSRPWALHSLRTLRLGWTRMCSFIV